MPNYLTMPAGDGGKEVVIIGSRFPEELRQAMAVFGDSAPGRASMPQQASAGAQGSASSAQGLGARREPANTGHR